MIWVWCIIHPVSTLADDAKIKYGFQIKHEYIDNFFWNIENRTSEVITTTTPFLELERRDERLDTRLKGQAQASQYRDNDSLNKIDFGCDTKINFKCTERINIFSSAGYDRDSRADRDIETTGLVLDTDQRDRYSLSQSLGWVLSEQLSLNSGFNYVNETWEKNAFDDEQKGFNARGISGSLNYKLGKWLETGVSKIILGAIRYDYPDSDIDSYYITTGISGSFSEITGGTVEIGLRSTEYHYFFEEDDFETSDRSVIGRVVAFRNGDKTSSKLVFSHDAQETSYLSRTTLRTSVSGSLTCHFDKNCDLRLNLTDVFNQAEAVENILSEVNSETLNVSTSLIYRISHIITFIVSYSHRQIDYKETSTIIERNQYSLQLIVSDSTHL